MLTLTHTKPNQSVLEFDNGIAVLFSYSTPVAAFIPGRGYVKTDQFYSVTTSKHINRWVGYNCHKTTQSEIDSLLAAMK